MPQTYQPLGDEVIVNTYTGGTQSGGGLHFLSTGNYYITWFDFTFNVAKAQFYFPDGATATDEVVLTASADGQINRAVATTPIAGGGFVAAWLDSSEVRIKAQIYDGAGHPVGSQFTITTTGGFARPMAHNVDSLPSGGFIVSWSNNQEGVHWQAYDAAGAVVGPAHFDPSLDSYHTPYNSEVLALASGGYAVAYALHNYNVDPEIPNAYGGFLLKVYDSNWNLLKTNSLPSDETGWDLTRLVNGGFVMVYRGGHSGIEAQVYDDSGNAVGSTIYVPWLGFESNAKVVALADGGFAVGWSDGYPQSGDTSGTSVNAQFYDATGHAVGSAILVNNVTAGNQSLGGMEIGPDGQIVFAWNSNTDVAARHFQLADSPPPSVIDGTPGNDNMTGTPGDETINGLAGNDSLSGAAGNDIIHAGPGNDVMFGGAWGAGQDVLDGGDGDDTYFVDTLDTVYEAVGGGHDAVAAKANYTLNPGAEVEVLCTNDNEGTVEIQLTGNEFGQAIVGNNGNNLLVGGGGADLLVGLGGADTYYVDADDRVYEAAGGGSDIVYARTNFVLNADAEVEYLRTPSQYLTTNLSLTGSAFGQQVEGDLGDNYLDGGGGADTLIGRAGNDTYIVDADDRVIDNGGYDVVAAKVSYTLELGQQIEVLSTTNNGGTDAINLTGNEFAQVLVGNAGANRLDGGGAADQLVGLGGDDTYIVDSLDRVYESAGGGFDRIEAKTSFILGLGQEVEQLATTNAAGTNALNLTGNGFDQSLTGNAGANYLDGGGGADTLTGLGGNDAYIVDADDHVVEVAGGGVDNVAAKVSYALEAGVSIEVLSTSSNTGNAAIDLTGNELGQVLVGNAGANVLDGGLGNDMLQGLAGADTFRFTTAPGAGNLDTILDFVSGTDRIALDDAVFTGLAPGPLPASAFVTGTAAQDADDRIIYDSSTGALWFDADGNGAGAAVQFATLTGHPTLIASDFTVI